jgi:hypothetical protein
MTKATSPHLIVRQDETNGNDLTDAIHFFISGNTFLSAPSA